MSAELTERVRTALDEHCTAASLHGPDLQDVLDRAAAQSNIGTDELAIRRRHRFAPLAVAAAVLVLVLGALVVPLLLPVPPQPPAAPDAVPGLPDRFAGISLVTGSVAASPPGQAIAYYTATPESIPAYYQLMTLSAHGDKYRRLTQADDRGCSGDQGIPFLDGSAEARLASNGMKVAIGDTCGNYGDIEMVDLGTGRSRHYPVQAGHGVRALAWSADSRYLAYLVAAQPREVGGTVKGILGILDLTTGRTQQFPAYTQVRTAAFRPDGTQLAIQDGKTLRIVGLDGRQLRTLAPKPYFELEGAQAWTPGGATLLTVPLKLSDTQAEFDQVSRQPNVYAYVNADGTERTAPAPVPMSMKYYLPILGWRSADTFLVAGPEEKVAGGTDALMEVSTKTGRPRVLSVLGGGEHPEYFFQLATALVPKMVIRPAAEPDRGPWPSWVGLTLAVLLAVTVGIVLLARFLVRRKPAAR